MKAIRSRADAKEVVNRLIETEGFITLWDTPTSILVITSIAKAECGCYVTYHEDTTDENWTQFQSMERIVDNIWRNRKFINQSGKLARL